MITIELDVSEILDLGDDTIAYSTTVEPRVELVVAKTGHDVVATAQVLVEFDTGFLKSTIGVDVDGLEFEAGPTAEYGLYLEEGTDGPYLIDNAFGWGITVKHPGIAPEPYLGPAFDVHYPRAEAAFERIAEGVWG